MILAGTISAGLLAWLIVSRTDHKRRWIPAVYGAVALAGNALSGRVTFALGTVFALAALCVVFAWPRTTAPRPSAGCARTAGRRDQRPRDGGQPGGGAFLGWSRPRCGCAGGGRRRTPSACRPCSSSRLGPALPFSGRQPMAWYSTILPRRDGVAVVILTPRTWRTVQAGSALYILAVVAAWLVPSPVGTNVSRLGLLFGGVVLVAAVTSAPGAPRWSRGGSASGPRRCCSRPP